MVLSTFSSKPLWLEFDILTGLIFLIGINSVPVVAAFAFVVPESTVAQLNKSWLDLSLSQTLENVDNFIKLGFVFCEFDAVDEKEETMV